MKRALFAFLLLRLSAVPALAGDEILIQAALDSQRYFRLDANRTYRLDAPLRIGPNMALEGCGSSSLLDWQGAGPYAIEFGDSAANMYRAWLRDFTLRHGGIRCNRVGANSGIERVIVYYAPEAGVLIDGPGDRFFLRDMDVQACLRGFHFIARGSHNGLGMERCHAAGNQREGVLVESVGSIHAYFSQFILRSCTIQGNGTNPATTAEVVFRGTIAGIILDHLYTESTRTTVGVSCEEQVFDDGRQRGPTALSMNNGSTIEGTKLLAAIALGKTPGIVRDSRLRKPISVAEGMPDPEQTGATTTSVVRPPALVPAPANAEVAKPAEPVAEPKPAG